MGEAQGWGDEGYIGMGLANGDLGGKEMDISFSSVLMLFASWNRNKTLDMGFFIPSAEFLGVFL